MYYTYIYMYIIYIIVYSEGESDLIYARESYSDGSYYEGQKKNNMRHGKGRLIYHTGASYEGEWNYGKMYGYGTLYFANGHIAYVGDWINDKFDGK